MCNAGIRGAVFGKQIVELEQRAGEILVPRSCARPEFPKTGKAATQIAGMCSDGNGRRVVVANADWRRMLAFEGFRSHHHARSDFAAWQKQACPLGELDSLQKILKLSSFKAIPGPAGVPEQPVAPTTRTDSAPSVAPVAGPPATPNADELVVGRGLGVTATAITMHPNEFVRHAAFLGATGSGKTTAALNIVEQLLALNVPTVLVDRKGDLCRYADPAAQERPLRQRDTRRGGVFPLRQKIKVALFTPGEPNGRPLALPIVPPAFDQLPEADRERFAQYASAALGSMIGFKSSDAEQGAAGKPWRKRSRLSAALLRAVITVTALAAHDRTTGRRALLNSIGGGYPEKYYTNLAEPPPHVGIE